jgi:1-deoxy-D-xylulose-5-phosphate synthase
LTSFSEAFPTRFFDVGIAEQHGVTFAAGLATEGFIPVVAIYSTFLQRAYDQILHDVCLDAHHVIFAIDRGGIVGDDGPTHHGLFDLSYLRGLPNMTVMAPRNEGELQRMIVTAVRHDGPVAFRYPRGAGEGARLSASPRPLPIGQAEVLASGDDILILAVGRPVNEALAARRLLAAEGIAATVVDCRFVKPLATDLIAELADRIPHVITVEENVLAGGFGSAVLECLNDLGIGTHALRRIGIADTFVEHGPQDLLRAKYGIDAAAIAAAARQLVATDAVRLRHTG